MHTTRTKLFVGIFLSILLCVLSCFGFAQIAKLGSKGQAPIKTLDVTIDARQKEELFVQLHSYAQDQAFKIIIRDIEVTTGPSGKGFFVEMLRDDVHITAVGNPSAPITVSVGFYDTDSSHPIQKETVDELCIALEESLNDVTNLSIIQPCADLVQ